MTKKLLFVVNDAAFFVSHRLPIALADHENGFEIHICTPSNSDMEALFASHGFVFHSAPLKRGKNSIIKEIKYIKYLYDLYKKYDFNVIHHVTIKPVLFGSIAARLAKVNAVVNAVSGMGYVFIKQGIKAAFIRKLVIAGYRFAFNQAKLVTIFQNDDDRALFLKHSILSCDNTRLIRGSGVDLTYFKASGLPKKTPITITLPARMLWDKGVDEFVEAARSLKPDYPNVIFNLAGGVDTENPAAISKEQLTTWHEDGVIHWLGHCQDMRAVYEQAHILCLPSYREGLPKALIEAMGCARAIITTDVAGCREVVEHQLNGLLVPVKNIQKLAEALVLLINDKLAQKEMGRQSRMKAEKEFSVEMVVEQTLRIYSDLS